MAKIIPRSRMYRSILLLVLLVVIGAGVYMVSRPKDKPQKPTHVSATIPYKKQSSSSASGNNTVAQHSDKSLGSTNSSSTLMTPASTGLVSNHRTNVAGQEQSVCITSPGASCYIEFTKNGVTKALAAQTTDRAGAAYWTWDIGKSGLSTGVWQITVVASLNGQTKTAQDSILLEVQP
jgi:hypothetical protein